MSKRKDGRTASKGGEPPTAKRRATHHFPGPGGQHLIRYQAQNVGRTRASYLQGAHMLGLTIVDWVGMGGKTGRGRRYLGGQSLLEVRSAHVGYRRSPKPSSDTCSKPNKSTTHPPHVSDVISFTGKRGCCVKRGASGKKWWPRKTNSK